ncbi:hypothetical protein BT69DRAFT_380127 [Atractiella rhizophila]|nr:hypothetical protein BT69DRAFT_380127 [Atractiella rhizophila]
MEAFPNTNTSPWRIVGQTEQGFIIELHGIYFIIPENMVLPLLGRLLAPTGHLKTLLSSRGSA